MNTVINEGGALCAYVDGVLVYRENRPEELQRVFLGLFLGDVTLGTARFTGRRIWAVAHELAAAVRE